MPTQKYVSCKRHTCLRSTVACTRRHRCRRLILSACRMSPRPLDTSSGGCLRWQHSLSKSPAHGSRYWPRIPLSRQSRGASIAAPRMVLITGPLRDEASSTLRMQITVFRNRPGVQEDNPSASAPKQLLFAHAVLSDPAARRLLHDQRPARIRSCPMCRMKLRVFVGRRPAFAAEELSSIRRASLQRGARSVFR